MKDHVEFVHKTHYICQTYVETPGPRGGPKGLQVDKLFEYTSAQQAEERAARECRNENCIGADAYMLVEDTQSGEVSTPTFLARFGTGPEMGDD